MATSIFLNIGIYIGPTRFLEIGLFNTKYNLKKRLSKRYTSANQSDNSKMKEVIAMDNNKNDNKEDF